jgi:hypothetical protein
MNMANELALQPLAATQRHDLLRSGRTRNDAGFDIPNVQEIGNGIVHTYVNVSLLEPSGTWKANGTYLQQR